MKTIIALENEYKIRNMKDIPLEIINTVKLEQKEDVIHFLDDIGIPVLVITKSNLKGNMSLFEYIDEIRRVNRDNRIILIVDKLTNELKERLFSKEVFNIIEGYEISYNELLENINNPRLVIYKEKEKISNIKKVVYVMGLSNSGKTYISKLLSDRLGRNGNKVLVLDFNTISPKLDYFVNCEKIYGIRELLKDILQSKVIRKSEYISKNIKYKNIDYILNSQNLGIPDKSTILKCINVYIDEYDYIIIDTSSFMYDQFVDVSNEISGIKLFVIDTKIDYIRRTKDIIIDDSFLVIINRAVFLSTNKRKVLENLGIKGEIQRVRYNILLELYMHGIIRKIYFNSRISNIYNHIRKDRKKNNE